MPHHSLKSWQSHWQARIDEVEDIRASVTPRGVVVPRKRGRPRGTVESDTESYVGSPSPPASLARRSPGADDDDEVLDGLVGHQSGYETPEQSESDGEGGDGDEEASDDESQMGVRGMQFTPGDLSAVGRYIAKFQPWDWKKATRKERWDVMALEVRAESLSCTLGC